MTVTGCASAAKESSTAAATGLIHIRNNLYSHDADPRSLNNIQPAAGIVTAAEHKASLKRGQKSAGLKIVLIARN